MMERDLLQRYRAELALLEEKSNLRSLPEIVHRGRYVVREGRQMLNLSSNDYLGLASDLPLRRAFLERLTPESFLPSASSSRLLTGNFAAYREVEERLCRLYGTESSLVFNSGYHMNTGILPAVCDSRTLIVADRLVHASLIDGIRLSPAAFLRYRHNDYEQLDAILGKKHADYGRIIIVTESIFSMDGDEADLRRLVALKKSYPGVMLYVDEAHAVGVRGVRGLGCAEEQACIADVDFLAGTFGKALASAGGYVVCRRVIRDYLVNKMRTLIFTTALPPVNLMWTHFVLERLEGFAARREHLGKISRRLREQLVAKGYACPSVSHIIPVMTGDSRRAVLKADDMQRQGFYMLPVRPPTVPEGTSRIRLSLTAAVRMEEVESVISSL
jgi:8-amino-7-oxononanoate synthase